MFSFLPKIHKALDDDSCTEIIAFYLYVSDASDKVPHFEVLCKIAKIGVGGCISEAVFHHLTNRKQFVRVENDCSQMKDVSSGVPQESRLLCICFNNLIESVIFMRPAFYRKLR